MATYSTSRTRRGVVIVSIVGEIDAYTAPKVRSGLRAAITDPKTRQLQVDLTGVTFLDSSGLSALIRCHAEADSRGIVLTVANPQPQPLNVIQLVGLADYLGLAVEDEGIG